MTNITISVPDDLLREASLSYETVAGMAQEALLVRLTALGAISAGRAAELLGISRRAFNERLDHYGVPWLGTEPDEVLADVQRAEAARDRL